MPLIAKESGGMKIDPVPEGVHIAVCYGVIDLGTHFSPMFQKSARKILLQWELPNCRGTFDRDGVPTDLPRAISERYTLSLHEKAELRGTLVAWLARSLTAAELEGFDLRQLLGRGCQLQVIHETKKDKTFAKIAALMALPQGVAKPPLENPPAYFAFEDPESCAIEELPQWVRREIMESDEWRALTGQPPVERPATPAPAAPVAQPVKAPIQPVKRAPIAPGASGDWFWDIICPVPRQGQTRNDYMRNPQTIRCLYDAMKAGDESAQKRLWGFASHFEPKPWVGKDGVTRPPGEADVQFRKALDAFKAWHDAQPKAAPTPEPDPEPEEGPEYDDVPF